MGKGSKTRPTDKKKFDKSYDRIFKKKTKLKKRAEANENTHSL